MYNKPNKPMKFLYAWATRINNQWIKVNYPIDDCDPAYLEDKINMLKTDQEMKSWSERITAAKYLKTLKTNI